MDTAGIRRRLRQTAASPAPEKPCVLSRQPEGGRGMKRNALRFGIQARVVGLALLFALLAAGTVLAGSAATRSMDAR